jgi:hypothetical protein
MTSEQSPYLSVVVTSRNDDHGGDPLKRLQAFINCFDAQCRRTGLDAEVIIVEWNPPANRPRLQTLIRWPEPSCCTYRFVDVPPEFHATLKYADVLPLFQMIAKNAGIRRARGRFVLATNIDIIFSNELIEYIASGRLEPGYLYRVDRHDIEAAIPVDASLDEYMAYCAQHQLRVHARWGSYAVDPRGHLVALLEDIVDGQTVKLGAGWHVREGTGAAGFYRWATDRAEVHVDLAGNPRRSGESVLEIDLEPNPYDPASIIDLDIVDESGRTFARLKVARRRVCRLAIPAGVQRCSFELRWAAPTDARRHLPVFERRGAMQYLVRSIVLKGVDQIQSSEAFSYPMDGWRVMPGAARGPLLDGAAFSVTTAARKWSYCLEYCPLRAPVTGTYRFVVSSEILEGDIALGVMRGDRRAWLPSSVAHVMTPRGDIFTVSVALEAGDHFLLMLSNDAPQGDRSSRFVVKALSGSVEPVSVIPWRARRAMPLAPAPVEREPSSVVEQPTRLRTRHRRLIDDLGAHIERRRTIKRAEAKRAPNVPSGSHVVTPTPWRARASRLMENLAARLERRRTIKQDAAQQALDFPASGWRAATASPAFEMQQTDRGMSIVSDPRKWSHCLEYGPVTAPATGVYRFELRYEAIEGAAHLGVLSADKKSSLPSTFNEAIGAESRTLLLSTKLRAGQIFWLALSNNHPDGEGISRFVVCELTTVVDLRDPVSVVSNAITRRIRPEGVIVDAQDGMRYALQNWQVADQSMGPIELTETGIAAATSPRKWAYCLTYGPLRAAQSGTYRFDLAYELDAGAIMLGALDGARKKWLPSSSTAMLTRDGRTMAMSVRLKEGKPFWLVISNDHPGGDAVSRFTIRELTSSITARGRDGILDAEDGMRYALQNWQVADQSMGPIELTETGIAAATSPRKWAYCLAYGPLRAAQSGTYRFDLAYELYAGGIALGALDGARREWLRSSSTETPTPDGRTVTMTVRLKKAQLFWLVLSNDHPDGDATSRFTIHALTGSVDPIDWETTLLGAADRSLAGIQRTVNRVAAFLRQAPARLRRGGPITSVEAAFCRLRDRVRRHVVLNSPEFKAAQQASLPLEAELARLGPLRDLDHLYKLLQERRPEPLHLNGCGDFQMMAREHWFELRGYPEFRTFSMNVDGLFSNVAHYGGIQERALESPCHIYHLEHEVGSGWTPEGDALLRRRIAERGIPWLDSRDVFVWSAYMHWLDRPMIFNTSDWGFGALALSETVIAPRQTVI